MLLMGITPENTAALLAETFSIALNHSIKEITENHPDDPDQKSRAKQLSNKMFFRNIGPLSGQLVGKIEETDHFSDTEHPPDQWQCPRKKHHIHQQQGCQIQGY